MYHSMHFDGKAVDKIYSDGVVIWSAVKEKRIAIPLTSIIVNAYNVVFKWQAPPVFSTMQSLMTGIRIGNSTFDISGTKSVRYNAGSLEALLFSKTNEMYEFLNSNGYPVRHNQEIQVTDISLLINEVVETTGFVFGDYDLVIDIPKIYNDAQIEEKLVAVDFYGRRFDLSYVVHDINYSTQNTTSIRLYRNMSDQGKSLWEFFREVGMRPEPDVYQSDPGLKLVFKN